MAERDDESPPPEAEPPEERPPEGEPDEPAEAAPEEDAEEEIEDPFSDERVKFMKDERLLGVTLEGSEKVGRRSIDVFMLSELLAQIDRVVRGLTAAVRGISLEPTGRIPRPPEAAPWRSRGVAFQHSATLWFVLGEPEVTRLSEEGQPTSPMIEAVSTLGGLIPLDPDEAVEEVRRFDDRIGNDYSRLLEILAVNELQSRWQPLDRTPTEVPPDRAHRVRVALRSELEPVQSVVTIEGFLFRLDAIRNDFKLQPEEGPAVTGSYDDELIPQLRDAWSQLVVAEVTRIEHRYAYATEPHRVEHRLRRIVRALESLDPPPDESPSG